MTREPDFEPYFTVSSSARAEGPFAIAVLRDSIFRVFYFREMESQYRPQEIASMTWLRTGLIKLDADTLEVSVLRSGFILSFIWDKNRQRMEFASEPGDETLAARGVTIPPR